MGALRFESLAELGVPCGQDIVDPLIECCVFGERMHVLPLPVLLRCRQVAISAGPQAFTCLLWFYPDAGIEPRKSDRFRLVSLSAHKPHRDFSRDRRPAFL